jgi:hypothetical protein
LTNACSCRSVVVKRSSLWLPELELELIISRWLWERGEKGEPALRLVVSYQPLYFSLCLPLYFLLLNLLWCHSVLLSLISFRFICCTCI